MHPQSSPSPQRSARFERQVVAITGSARGIGKSIAAGFAGEGATVIICDFDQAAGEATAAAFRQRGLSAEYLSVDLSQRGAPQSMVIEIAQRWGRLDVLVNSARATRQGRSGNPVEDEDSWEREMNVSLRAAFLAAQQALLVMARTGGSIVNIGSILTLCADRKVSPLYQIAKAGLVQITRFFALQGGPTRVRVNAVLPGMIVQDEHRSRYNRDDNQRYRQLCEFCIPVQKVGSSDDVAKACLFLASSEAGFINGHSLVVDGGSTVQEQVGLFLDFDGLAQ